MRIAQVFAAVGATMLAVSTAAYAEPQTQSQTWPQRTVHLIVPLPPGTGTDIAARLFADRLAARWGQAVVVENRQGADGIPAVTGFVGAHDDHTLLLSFGGIITINPLIHDKLPYDPARDVVPVSAVANNFLAFAATGSMGVKTLREFEDAVRKQPGKLNWAATPGLPLYAFDALLRGANLKMQQVSYRDFMPALQDFNQGRIHLAATGVLTLLTQEKAGHAKVLAVLNHQRYPMAPDVPTIAEAGHPDLTLDAVVGLYGWRDMPAGLKAKIAADVRAVGADPEIGKRLLAGGSVVETGTPAEFAASIEQQRQTVLRMTEGNPPK